MEDLPNILIRKTALSLPFAEITSLCRTNTKFNKAICEYQQFWHDKLILDYGINEKFSEALDWKKIYIYYTFNRLIGLGSNRSGELGLGRIIWVKEFTEIAIAAIKDIACGFRHTVIVDIDGNLWGTGKNDYGGLAINTGQNIKNFVQLAHGLRFIQIACGFHHTLALSNDNKIWVTGNNREGQIGLGSIDQVDQFVKLKGYRAKQIACGGVHSAFIDLNRNLYTFGSKYSGQLGRDGNHAILDKALIDIPIIQVSCGGNHTACIDSNNDIWIFGNNLYGQLGLEKTKSQTKYMYPEKISNHKAKYISCGDTYTAFIDPEDHVWTFGNNKLGQLGLQGIKRQYIPKRITQVYDQGQIINRDFRVREVHCGNDTTLFIDLEDNLWVTGRNVKLNIDSKVPAMIPRIKTSKVATGHDCMVIIGYYN